MVDAKDASPTAAGLRELREETGYEGENPRLIGQIFPNPPTMRTSARRCWWRIAAACTRSNLIMARTWWTRLVPIADLPRLVADGKIQHSLVVVALYYFELWECGYVREGEVLASRNSG